MISAESRGQGRVIIQNSFNTVGFGGKIRCRSIKAEDDIQVKFITLYIRDDIARRCFVF